MPLGPCSCGSRQRSDRCTKCRVGSLLCTAHGKRRNHCLQCAQERVARGESATYSDRRGEICACTPPMLRKYCAKHGGSHLCTSCRLKRMGKSNSICADFYRWESGGGFPKPRKEKRFQAFLDARIGEGWIPPYDLRNQRIETTSYRPDYLWKLKDHWVWLEYDEFQHHHDSYPCERRRELDVLGAAEGKRVFLLRFNPDSFRTGFKASRAVLPETKREERFNAVLRELVRVLSDESVNQVFRGNLFCITKMFYNCDCAAGSQCSFTHSEFFCSDREYLLANTRAI